MRNLFSSDYHLGHANIIKYCNRPFKSLKEMNGTIIRNHNARVKSNDTVFIIGDFCFRNTRGGKKGEGDLIGAITYEKRLKGKLVFVEGNHDKSNSCKTCIHRLIIHLGGKKINLVHDPKNISYDYDVNLVGHVHNNWKIKRFKKLLFVDNGKEIFKTTDAINVGVDVWSFRPITIEEIISRYSKWLRERNDN